MRGVGAHDPAPAAHARRQGVVPPLQLVHALEVELEAALLAVDLDLVAVLVAGGQARGLEACHRTARHARQEEDRIVHGALALAAAARGALGTLSGDGAAGALDDVALLDEGLLDGAHHLGHFLTGDEAGHVDDVRVEVTVRAAAGKLALEAPQERRGRAAPVLEVAGAHMEDAAELPFLHQLVRERHGRATAVVEPDEGADALLGSLGGGIAHGAGLGQGAGERLLAGHVLAGGQGGDGNLGMDVVGGAVVDQAHLGVGKQVLPVVRAALPAPALGEFGHVLDLGPGHGPHVDVHGQVEELGRGHPRVAVGLAHELGADESDAEGGVLHKDAYPTRHLWELPTTPIVRLPSTPA